MLLIRYEIVKFVELECFLGEGVHLGGEMNAGVLQAGLVPSMLFELP